ncbi:hypothetical protein LV779_36895 [Streptomyces thinghirensis]|nr:hypothetical protein [Streptomyces thinghirensis]
MLILLVLGVSPGRRLHVVALSMIPVAAPPGGHRPRSPRTACPSVVKPSSPRPTRRTSAPSVESVGVHSQDEISRVAARPSATCTAGRSRLALSRPCCGAASARCSPPLAPLPGSDPAPAVADLGTTGPAGPTADQLSSLFKLNHTRDPHAP